MLVVFFLFCIASSLAFLIIAKRINLMQCFFPPNYLRWRQSSCPYTNFVFWKILQFLGCFIFSSFDRQLCHKCDERGRNFMCECTLPSLLVVFIFKANTKLLLDIKMNYPFIAQNSTITSNESLWVVFFGCAYLKRKKSYITTLAEGTEKASDKFTLQNMNFYILIRLEKTLA